MDITKDFGSVDKFSRLYKIERIVFDFFLRIFYKKFIVKGLENLPADKPFIVAGNHQNALMDSLVLLKLLERPVFISRADLFKKKTLLTRFLVFCRIIPSYRMRDGKENLHLNNLVFRRVAEILKNGAPIVIFPEAQHFDKRHLLPIKKGITRMAFLAEQNADFKLDTQIVPVGIYYENYFNFQSDVKINFGKSIRVLKYKDIYLENEAKANNLLRDEIAEAIKKQIIHISDLENYQAFETIRYVYRNQMLKELKLENKGINDVLADKQTIEFLESERENKQEKVESIINNAVKYGEFLKANKFRNWLFEKEDFCILAFFGEFLVYILFFPAFLYGFLNNLPAMLPQFFINKKFKDAQFHSSIRFVTFTFVTPFIHLIQFFIISLFTDIWWVKWAYLFSLLPMGFFAHRYLTFFTKWNAKFRYNLLKIRNKEKYNEINDLRKKIINEISDLRKNFSFKN